MAETIHKQADKRTSPYLLQHAHNRSIGIRGGLKLSHGRELKTSRFYFQSAIPPVTGATSWSTSRLRTKRSRSS
jgi:hypothetical protein